MADRVQPPATDLPNAINDASDRSSQEQSQQQPRQLAWVPPPRELSHQPQQPQRTFLVGTGTRSTTVQYIREYSEMVNTVKELRDFLFRFQGMTVRNEQPCPFISVDCEGVPKNLQLIQIATSQNRAYIFDCEAIGKEPVLKWLEPILDSETVIKLFHDVHQDAKAIFKFGGITLKGVLDTQL
ncbi:MAG: hypothetical protein SGARI_002187, partial [Bacillariaceae sp.]